MVLFFSVIGEGKCEINSSPISRKGVCAKLPVLSYRYHPIPYAMVYLVSNRHDDTAKTGRVIQ